MSRDRHYCATCVHIEHLVTPTGTVYRCRRLGWQTLPRWRFNCWQERPRTVKMPSRTLAGDGSR